MSVMVFYLPARTTGSPIYLGETKRPIAKKMAWTIDRTMIVGGVGIFDSRIPGPIWEGSCICALNKGDTFTVDLSKVTIRVSGCDVTLGDVL